MPCRAPASTTWTWTAASSSCTPGQGRTGAGRLGIDTDGKPVFLGLAPGAAESTDAWRALLADLIDRGLGCPLLVIPDGGKGLGAAIECSFPASLDQRCVVQVCRNLIAKVPTTPRTR